MRSLLIIATAIAVLLLMGGTFVLRMSPEIFDSGYNTTTWLVFSFVWLMPILLVAGIVTAWIGFARNARPTVVAGLLLATVPLLIAAGIIAMAG